jgi:hypothetical protein
VLPRQSDSLLGAGIGKHVTASDVIWLEISVADTVVKSRQTRSKGYLLGPNQIKLFEKWITRGLGLMNLCIGLSYASAACLLFAHFHTASATQVLSQAAVMHMTAVYTSVYDER